jgi:hypothetical protein
MLGQSRYFHGGMDSFTIPDQLNAFEYVFGQNIVCRGGLPQTRPGTRSLFCLPAGRRQGFYTFTPGSGAAHHVVAIAGVIYVSADPFRSWRILPNVQLSASARYVTFAEGLKSTGITDAGEPFGLENPYRVLIMQDGLTRAAYWDGGTSGHLNPTVLAGEATAAGYDETKIGLWMAFAGSRLWVARRNKIYASDLGNPLKFTESEYLNELPFLPLDAECTGMIELADKSGLLVFTETSCYLIKSSIQDRTQWSSTVDFFAPILNIGCIAPRSIVQQHGLIYWFCPAGLISLDDALRANQSSELVPLDTEMAFSKAYIGPILADICCAIHENYILVSVPFCSLENTHTWAMDLATFEGGNRSWNAVWTGWRPVQWSSAIVQGRQRCFFLSHDFDDNNRIWEAFMGDRTDNGCAITCSAQFRLDNLQSNERKRYRHAEIDIVQLYGEVSCMAAVASWKGWFDRIMTKEMVASTGRINLDTSYGSGTAAHPLMGGNRPQVRTLRTTNWDNPSTCNACDVESDVLNNIDTHFQLFVGWSGRMGIAAVRQYAVESPSDREGKCEEADPESGHHTLMETGCASTEEFPTEEAFPTFEGSGSATRTTIPGIANSIAVETCAESQISQADATRKAACFAQGQINALVSRQEILNDLTFAEGCTRVTISGPTAQLAVYLEDGVTLVTAADFAMLLAGDTEQMVLILKNIGAADLTITSLTIIGTNPSAFSVTIAQASRP